MGMARYKVLFVLFWEEERSRVELFPESMTR